MSDEPGNLADLKRWYRREIIAEMGSGAIHSHLTDGGGDPDWLERFKCLMAFPLDATLDLPGGDLKPLRSFPIRWHLRYMARSGKHGYRRARFLFVLACQDFSVTEAAKAVSPAGWDEHGEQWALSYAEHSLRELWRRLHDPERTEADGRPRTFVQKRISKSEAQYRAEEAQEASRP